MLATLANAEHSDSAIDPMAGTGDMLEVVRSLNPNVKLSGIEIDKDVFAHASKRLKASDANLIRGSAFSQKKLSLLRKNNFDLVITNPPYVRYQSNAETRGSDVCSAFIPLNATIGEKLLIDQTLYWAWVASEDEAVYLSGMLNSEAANELIKAFQPRGQQGERHIHELAFGITPPFDPAQEAHAEVVRITKALLIEYDDRIKSAEQNGEEFIQWLNPGKDLAKRRSKLREIIRSLPSYEAYTSVCASVYGA